MRNGRPGSTIEALPGRQNSATVYPDQRYRLTLCAAYHDLWQVEESFRMAKSDIRARPMFHHRRDSIEAHLTVVFAGLAVARFLQQATGVSINKLVRALKPLRTVTIEVNGHELTAAPSVPTEVQKILNAVEPESTH